MEPIVERPDIPAEYGDPKQRLEWADVERRLEERERLLDRQH